MDQQIIYLMLGYPGAGKTTVAKIIQKLTGARYLSSDVLRRQMFPKSRFSQNEHNSLYSELDAQLVALVNHGHSVIYDANLNRHIHRAQKYELLQKYGCRAVVVWVQTPKDIARERRIEDVKQHHLVPPHETPEHMFN